MGPAVSPRALLPVYDGKAAPRYTSYPSVPFWRPGFAEADYLDALDDLADRPDEPVSVYVHLPFCAKRCYYCGCNAVVNHYPGVVDRYLDRVEAEMARVVRRVGRRRAAGAHWGGGTPNFLDARQMTRLARLLRTGFDLAPDAELSLEMDPRIGRPEQAHLLRELGFTRVSLGVQDLDPRVQAAIGRLQREEDTLALWAACRDAGFASVNLDLVYGLPHQTPETFDRTLDRILALRPERVATFAYAHLPALRPNQRAVDASGLPDADGRLRIAQRAVERFRAAGYEWVGMDHFAVAEDELAIAARARRLSRTFMGYVARPVPHTLAFGMSAIGFVAGRFVQNDAELRRYEDGVAAGRLPVARGHRLDDDDRLRRRVIEHLMCNLEIPRSLTVDAFGAPVDVLLPGEAARLAPLVADGVLEETDGGWRVTDAGRFFVRHAAAVFDAYLRAGQARPALSAAV